MVKSKLGFLWVQYKPVGHLTIAIMWSMSSSPLTNYVKSLECTLLLYDQDFGAFFEIPPMQMTLYFLVK